MNDPLDAQRGGIYFWPRIFSLKAYQAIFLTPELLNSYKISIFRVVAGTILHVLLCAMFAYALTKRKFIFRKFLNWWMLIPMYFAGGLIPFYVILNMLGLLDNVLVYIFPSLLSTMHILLIRTFMNELPGSLTESALIDGAGELLIFSRIIFPLSKPILATVALLIGVHHWNDWFTGFTFISDEKLWSAQNVLLKIIQTNEASNLAYIFQMNSGFRTEITSESVKMAMLVVTIVPIVISYPFLQKFFIKGIMLGSVKG